MSAALSQFAHTSTERPWEPLFTNCPARCSGLESACGECGHLDRVAKLAAAFAEEMFLAGTRNGETARQWGRLAGQWHDLGKFAPRWQEYLRIKAGADPHQDEVAGKMDHSTAGAQHARDAGALGPLLAYIIAGHHGGMPDGIYLFWERLKEPIPINPWREAAACFSLPGAEVLNVFPIQPQVAGAVPFAFATRMLFSCLVDADFLATEAYMQPGRQAVRPDFGGEILGEMRTALNAFYANNFVSVEDAAGVNSHRAGVHTACLKAAEREPGFFSLTVPTGGGKTLASLAFALEHAIRHGLRRVIYVIPYTSIIEQNADVFRKVFETLSQRLGQEIVLEHHSNLNPRRETERMRLMAENWDAPLIVTTNVQFFESLFANRPGACRKLRHVARSVVIFDEAQTLPVRLLSPILQALQCLVFDHGVTAVLCTATQPALEQRESFSPGIPADRVREIIPDRKQLFTALSRVDVKNLGTINKEELHRHVLDHAGEGALVVVNTTRAAREICQALSDHMPVLHLSARMCPAHRTAVLTAAKKAIEEKQPVLMVSTQIVECGVDISFPVVFRAECGIDSLAQAAGRCNRNGELTDADGIRCKGKVFLFSCQDYPIPEMLTDLRAMANVTSAQILPNFDEADLLSLEAVETFFRQAIWQAGQTTNNWDKGKRRDGRCLHLVAPPAGARIET